MSLDEIHTLITKLPEPLSSTRAWSRCDDRTVAEAVEHVFQLWNESRNYGLREEQRTRLDRQLHRAGHRLACTIGNYDGPGSRYERESVRYWHWTKTLEKIADALHVTVQHLQCPRI